MAIRIWRVVSAALRYGGVFALGFLTPVISIVVANKTGAVEKARDLPVPPKPRIRDRIAVWALDAMESGNTEAGVADV